MRISALSITLTLALLTGHSVEFSAQGIEVPSAHHRLRSFLLAAYPELAGRPTQVEIRGRAPSLTIDVSETTADGGSSRPSAQRLMKARVMLTADSELRSFDADTGPLVQAGPNALLAQATLLAFRRGENQDSFLLSQALAFGPDRAGDLVARFRQLNLSDRLGALRVVSVSPRRLLDSSAHAFLWSIEVEGVRVGDVSRLYELLFEPVSGQLISVRMK
jgi:hypothetical protein